MDNPPLIRISMIVSPRTTKDKVALLTFKTQSRVKSKHCGTQLENVTSTYICELQRIFELHSISKKLRF